MAQGTGLENQQFRKGLVGSNPTSSAWNGLHIGKSARLESECSFMWAVRSTRTHSVLESNPVVGNQLGKLVVGASRPRFESFALRFLIRPKRPYTHNSGSRPEFPAIWGIAFGQSWLPHSGEIFLGESVLHWCQVLVC